MVCRAAAKSTISGSSTSAQSANTPRSRSRTSPTGCSGRSVSRGRASRSTTVAGRSGRIASGCMPRCSDISISLRSLSRTRCSRFRITVSCDATFGGEARCAPAAVVAAVAPEPLVRAQRQQRGGQPAPLRLGPARLGLVEDRRLGDVVEREQRRPGARAAGSARRSRRFAAASREILPAPAASRAAGTHAGRPPAPRPGPGPDRAARPARRRRPSSGSRPPAARTPRGRRPAPARPARSLPPSCPAARLHLEDTRIGQT